MIQLARRTLTVAVVMVIIIGALVSGLALLYYLLYLVGIVTGGAWLLTRNGLGGIEAGFTLDKRRAQVGEQLSATFRIRSRGRLPRPWLEVWAPTNLPTPVPGRALALGPYGERTWTSRVPLTRRGRWRIDPLVVRTADPFGLFEASATVGSPSEVIVFPRIEPLPRWRLPGAELEGVHAHAVRTFHATPLTTGVRPWAPGDAFSRIHWPMTARLSELTVKEFDLEQTSDAWILLDLDHGVHSGQGELSTLETGVRVAASIAARAIEDRRAVGITAFGRRPTRIPGDRGARQHLKIMELLAAVDADGQQPLVEGLVTEMGQLRRGMSAIVVTPSLDSSWILPLSTLRTRGVSCAIVLLRPVATSPDEELGRDRIRALAVELGIRCHVVTPGVPLAEVLAG